MTTGQRPARPVPALLDDFDQAPRDPVAPFFDGSQLCAETDPEAFFPDRGGSARDAKRICQLCQFREPCLEYALVTRIDGLPLAGVWGGTSTIERQRLRAARGIETEVTRRRKLEDRDQRILTLRQEESLPAKTIAGRLGVSEATVATVLRKHNVPRLQRESVTSGPERQRRRAAAARRRAAVKAPPAPTRVTQVRDQPPSAATLPARGWTDGELAVAVAELARYGMRPSEIGMHLSVSVRAVRQHWKAGAA